MISTRTVRSRKAPSIHWTVALLVVLASMVGAPGLEAQGYATQGPHKTTEMGDSYKRGGHRDDVARGVYYVPASDLENFRVHFEQDPDGVVRAKRRDANGQLQPIDTRGLSGGFADQANSVIYVMDAAGELFVIHPSWVPEAAGRDFHHSSIPNGEPVAGAGHIGFVDGADA